jgi:hypothetical protein
MAQIESIRYEIIYWIYETEIGFKGVLEDGIVSTEHLPL